MACPEVRRVPAGGLGQSARVPTERPQRAATAAGAAPPPARSHESRIAVAFWCGGAQRQRPSRTRRLDYSRVEQLRAEQDADERTTTTRCAVSASFACTRPTQNAMYIYLCLLRSTTRPKQLKLAQ